MNSRMSLSAFSVGGALLLTPAQLSAADYVWWPKTANIKEAIFGAASEPCGELFVRCLGANGRLLPKLFLDIKVRNPKCKSDRGSANSGHEFACSFELIRKNELGDTRRQQCAAKIVGAAGDHFPFWYVAGDATFASGPLQTTCRLSLEE